jgi:hypothetical protein
MRSCLRAAEENATSLMSIETGSLSAAARQLKTPLPTISRKIFDLESHMPTKLFNRAASSSLTQATIFQNSTPSYIPL